MRERDLEDLIEAAKEIVQNGHAPYCCTSGEDGGPCCCGIENLRDVLERIQ